MAGTQGLKSERVFAELLLFLNDLDGFATFWGWSGHEDWPKHRAHLEDRYRGPFLYALSGDGTEPPRLSKGAITRGIKERRHKEFAGTIRLPIGGSDDMSPTERAEFQEKRLALLVARFEARELGKPVPPLPSRPDVATVPMKATDYLEEMSPATEQAQREICAWRSWPTPPSRDVVRFISDELAPLDARIRLAVGGRVMEQFAIARARGILRLCRCCPKRGVTPARVLVRGRGQNARRLCDVCRDIPRVVRHRRGWT